MSAGDAVTVRIADPDRDAERIAAIYLPVVERTAASFEEVAPDTAQTRRRMANTLRRTPWLVAERSGRVVGFGYAGPHRSRPAYRWSVEVSAYVGAPERGRGVGRALYAFLLPLLREQAYVHAYAAVTLPNPASEALHERAGFRRFAVFDDVGHKLGAWHSVAWYEVRLAAPGQPPAEPVAFPDLPADRLAACGLA